MYRIWRRLMFSLMLFVPLPVAAEWHVAESAHFRIFGNMPAEMLRARANLLEDYRDMLGTFTTAQPVEGQPRLDIYLVDDIQQAVPFGRIDSNIAGFYSASQSGIVAFATTGGFGQTTLLHEYAHHHMFSTGAAVYPAWFVEGFAEYFSTARFRPDRIEFGLADNGRALNLAYTPVWTPFAKIVDPDYRYRTAEQAAMFYAQSWLLTHYMFRAPGMAARHRAYLEAVAAGEPALTAFTRLVEPAPAKFDRLLRTYLRASATYSQFRRPPRAPAAVSVRPLGRSARRLLLLVAAMEHDGAVKDRGAALAQVRAAAAAFPGDDLAERTLAQAELTFGEPGAAIARLDTLLGASPDDPTLLRWKAEALQALPNSADAANRSTIRRLLARAFKADPADWRTMHDYLHSFDLEHAPLRDGEFLVLQRAYQLAPQVDGLAIDMAAALMQRGDSAGAAKALSSVAFSPHESGFTRLARALRQRAEAKDTQGFVTILDRGPPPPDAVPAADKAGGDKIGGDKAGGGRAGGGRAGGAKRRDGQTSGQRDAMTPQ